MPFTHNVTIFIAAHWEGVSPVNDVPHHIEFDNIYYLQMI